jgi:putative hemolysin
VAPVYFEGQNSRLFQVASHIHMTLRLSLLFKEPHDRIGDQVALHPGAGNPLRRTGAFGRRKAADGSFARPHL